MKPTAALYLRIAAVVRRLPSQCSLLVLITSSPRLQRYNAKKYPISAEDAFWLAFDEKLATYRKNFQTPVNIQAYVTHQQLHCTAASADHPVALIRRSTRTTSTSLEHPTFSPIPRSTRIIKQTGLWHSVPLHHSPFLSLLLSAVVRSGLDLL